MSVSCIVYVKSIRVRRVCSCVEQLSCLFSFCWLGGGREDTLHDRYMYMYMYMYMMNRIRNIFRET